MTKQTIQIPTLTGEIATFEFDLSNRTLEITSVDIAVEPATPAPVADKAPKAGA